MAKAPGDGRMAAVTSIHEYGRVVPTHPPGDTRVLFPMFQNGNPLRVAQPAGRFAHSGNMILSTGYCAAPYACHAVMTGAHQTRHPTPFHLRRQRFDACVSSTSPRASMLRPDRCRPMPSGCCRYSASACFSCPPTAAWAGCCRLALIRRGRHQVRKRPTRSDNVFDSPDNC